jgi:hypothetical protein
LVCFQREVYHKEQSISANGRCALSPVDLFWLYSGNLEEKIAMLPVLLGEKTDRT